MDTIEEIIAKDPIQAANPAFQTHEPTKKSWFKGRSRKTYAIWGTQFLLLVGMVGVVTNIARIQSLVSRAAGEVQLSYSSPSLTLEPNKESSVKVIINTNGHPVAGVDIQMKYDSAMVQGIQFIPSTAFDHVIINTPPQDASGTVRFSAIAQNVTPVTGQIELGTLKVKGKQAGKTDLSFQIADIGSTDATAPLPVTLTTTTLSFSSNSASVEAVRTADAAKVTKTTFLPGDTINFIATMNNSSPSAALSKNTFRIEPVTTVTTAILNWTGDTNYPAGKTEMPITRTLPTTMPTGDYIFHVISVSNGITTEAKSSFTVTTAQASPTPTTAPSSSATVVPATSGPTPAASVTPTATPNQLLVPTSATTSAAPGN